jgi:DNA-binding NarL/FixJ family response regulator
MNQQNNRTELSRRQKEILKELASGKMYKEIAHQYDISIDTVKKHCKNIYRKLNVNGRAEAAHFYDTNND